MEQPAPRPVEPLLADRATSLVAWTIAWRAASAVSTLALGALLVRQVSIADYGRYTLVLSVLVYLALIATFGQDQALLRYLPEVLGRGDRAAIYDLLRKSAIAVLIAWGILSVAVWLSRPLIDAVLQAQVADLLALGTLLLLSTVATGVLSFALVTIYDMRTQALATPLAGLLTLALAFVLLRRDGRVESVLLAGAAGQGALALTYAVVLLRTVRAAPMKPGPPISWPRLLRYASGWLPSLLIASAVGIQFENLFLQRFRDATAVAYYDTAYTIPQRLVALIPSLLTGAWVVGTLAQAQAKGARLRRAVIAFYKGIFLVAFPLGVAAGALLPPLIRVIYTDRLGPAATIAPLLLVCFMAALLASPWGLVVRVRELAWANAGVSLLQLAFAAGADFWLIQASGLGGAVLAVAFTTALTLVVTFIAWRWLDVDSLAVPWPYAARCLLTALPYAGLFPLAWIRVPLPALLAAAAVATPAWALLVRRLGLLQPLEVPLLHESRHRPVQWALRWLAPATGR